MNKSTFFLFTFFLGVFSFAQVGVNAVSIDPSAALDIQYGSAPKGLLTPRMTSVQRTGMVSPADGLIVYDTDIKSFYHYQTAAPAGWVRVSSEVSGRANFKRIKSTGDLAAEKSAGGNAKYLLNTNTYYEINGAVTFDLPIDLNNAYLVGLDAYEDKLIRTGDLFVGTTGGTIKNLMISVTGGAVFNLAGADTQNLLFRDCIVSGCTNVGSISGFGLVFSSVVQYVGNTNGITYNNIKRLLLSNIAWLGNNQGTFEKYTGTFTLIQKLGGSIEVNGTAIGMDVSTNPIITGDAVMESVVFTGLLTTGLYIKRYTTGSYTGYNFNNSWQVRCPGIPVETDNNAVGEFSFDYPVGSGGSTTFNNSVPSNITKVIGTSLTENLFRFSTDSSNNRLMYLGRRKRSFEVSGSISFQVATANTFIIYIAKQGSVISKYKVYGRGAAANDIVVLPLNALVELSPGEYIEVYAQRYSGTTNNDAIITPNMTLVIK